MTQLETAANTELLLARGRIRELEHVPQPEILAVTNEIIAVQEAEVPETEPQEIESTATELSPSQP